MIVLTSLNDRDTDNIYVITFDAAQSLKYVTRV